MSHLGTWIIVLSQLTVALTGPIHAPYLSGSIGMNMRNLPCVSTRTGETGVCMFAIMCEKANGTHLSTCLDRFYFGSCCKLHDVPEVRPQENALETGLASSSFVVTDSAIWSNKIPDDLERPKPIIKNQTISLATPLSNDIITKTNASLFNTSHNTTQTIGLSTFQTVQNYSQDGWYTVTTERNNQESLSSYTIPQKAPNTESAISITNNKGPASTSEPTLSTSSGINNSAVTEMKTPSSVHDTTPAIAQRPAISSTSKPQPSTTERTVPPTRFPPRNTTTTRPSQVTTMSFRPSTSTSSLSNASSTMSITTEIFTNPQQLTSDANPSTNQSTILSIPSLIFNGILLTGELSSSTKLPTTVENIEEDTLSTHSPGLVTWSSNVNYEVTKAPQISSSSPTVTQEVKPANGSAFTESISSLGPTVPTIALNNDIAGGNVTGLPVPADNLNMSDYTQVCGMRLLSESRIVGGGPTTFGKWPWQVSLQTWNKTTSVFDHSCGAVLYTDNWAITAAHCVENVPWKRLLLRIGKYNLNVQDEPYESEERRVDFVFRHPQFDRFTYEYDLALLRFDKPLKKFQPNILPICLPEDDEGYVGRTAFVTGWGRLYYDGRLPSVMREVSIPVISNTVCEAMYRQAGYNETVPNIFICAGRPGGGIDSCEGDSGGPMVIQRVSDGRWILTGVISWGIGCGSPNQPGVYTRISEFREWITQSVKLVDEAFLEAGKLV